MYWQTTSILMWQINNNLETFDLWSIGLAILFCIVFAVNLKLMVATNTHNLFSVFLLIFSMGSYIAASMFFGKLETAAVFNAWNVLTSSSVFFFTMLLMIASCMLCEYAWRSIHYIIEEVLVKQTIKLFTKPKSMSGSSSSKKMDLKSDFGENRSSREVEIKITNSINNNNIEDSLEEEFITKESNDEVKIKAPEKEITIHTIPNDIDQSIVYDPYLRRCNYIL